MDKVWLYIGGILVALVVGALVVLNVVKNSTPPASDLRSAYENTKK